MALRKRKPLAKQSQTQEKFCETDKKNTILISKLSWFEDNFGFSLESLTSLEKLTTLLYKPCDGSSLAIIRIMFGIVMLIDITEERGFSNAEILWGNPDECRFPLFNFLKPLPVKWMCFLYIIMCIGAIGISLGFYFKQSCLALLIPYWYIFLLNKTAWNNHSYLYGLLLILMSISSANNCWSLDKLIRKIKTEGTVPLWNYTILRFQVFALYFFAGLKKIDGDWLRGYSMTTLSKHWVFSPFRFVLTNDQIDLWIVHVSGFLLDFISGFLIYFDSTRIIAFFFLSMFHFMNSRLFNIGMFPYMCLITMPVFCSTDWPRELINYLNPQRIFYTTNKEQAQLIQTQDVHDEKSLKDVNKTQKSNKNNSMISQKKKLTSLFILFYISLQCFLPYSHFITKGYNNWTNGLYGYSWDMMVHSWDRNKIIVKIIDKSSNEDHFLDYEKLVPSEKWATHADMLIQFAQCVKENIQIQRPSLTNISVYIDVWCSLNGRLQQRMFDPTVDLLTAPWSPFQKIEWLMPLLTDYSHWREKISNIQNEVWSWSNYTNAVFYADFPGLTLENYITSGLSNVTLTVLDGAVIMEVDEKGNTSIISGEEAYVPTKSFHKIHTISSTPSCYLYSFVNSTQSKSDKDLENINVLSLFDSFFYDVKNRWENVLKIRSLIYKMYFTGHGFF